MQNWEQAMWCAKQAYQRKSFSVAIRQNKLALEIAKDGHRDNFFFDAEQAVSQVVVSYLSLSDDYIAIGDWMKADSMFEEVFTYLASINKFARNSSERASTVIRAASRLRIEWEAYLGKRPGPASLVRPDLASRFARFPSAPEIVN